MIRLLRNVCNTYRPYIWEFRIYKREHPEAYDSAGLSYDSKFDLRNILELLFNDAYFSVSPHAPQGKLQSWELFIRA